MNLGLVYYRVLFCVNINFKLVLHLLGEIRRYYLKNKCLTNSGHR